MVEVWASKQRMLDAMQAAEDDDNADHVELDITWPDFHDDTDAAGSAESVNGHVHGDVPTVYMQLTDPTEVDAELDRSPPNVKPGDIWVERDPETFV